MFWIFFLVLSSGSVCKHEPKSNKWYRTLMSTNYGGRTGTVKRITIDQGYTVQIWTVDTTESSAGTHTFNMESDQRWPLRGNWTSKPNLGRRLNPIHTREHFVPPNSFFFFVVLSKRLGVEPSPAVTFSFNINHTRLTCFSKARSRFLPWQPLRIPWNRNFYELAVCSWCLADILFVHCTQLCISSDCELLVLVVYF